MVGGGPGVEGLGYYSYSLSFLPGPHTRIILPTFAADARGPLLKAAEDPRPVPDDVPPKPVVVVHLRQVFELPRLLLLLVHRH